jgi:hypothetical protein
MEADDGGYGSVRLCVAEPLGSAGINATDFPDVTTRRCVCGDNSMDVIGPGNVRHFVRVRVRRSHHLSKSDDVEKVNTIYVVYLLDQSVLTSGHSGMVPDPYHALHRAFVRQPTILAEKIGFRIWPAKIKNPNFLFLPTSQEV